MKDISTLVEDIYGLFGKEYIPIEGALEEFAGKLATKIRYRILEEERPASLRLSNIGTECHRQLWFKVNQPEVIEKLPPEVRMKFLYGDILEELLLFLAREAGHTVEGEQDEVSLFGVKGHRDSVIDGHVIDVKSASSFAFKKFKSGLKKDDDAFGYLSQLSGYLEASYDDPVVTIKDKAGFLVIDKTTGHIHLDMHQFSFTGTEKKLQRLKDNLADPVPPRRHYEPEEDGKSGNLKLGVNCSYCPAKKACYPKLRGFLYYSGPVYLTKVLREPNVPEIPV